MTTKQTLVLQQVQSQDRIRATAPLSGSLSGEWIVDLFETIASTARWHLGLTEDEAEILFTENPAGMGRRFTEDDDRIGGWPAPFNEQWREGDKPSSEIAVDYLDHIIETGKVIE